MDVGVPNRILLEVAPGNLEVYLNANADIPTPQSYTCCAGVFPNESITDFDNFTTDPSTFILTNIYDRYLPRNFTRMPISYNSQNFSNKIPEIPIKLCISSEEWEGIAPICTITILNSQGFPVNFTIKHSQIEEFSLLPPILQEKIQIFNKVFEDIEGSKLSRAETKRKGIWGNKEFTYGEIEFIDVISIFELSRPRPGETFWDLGCGNGRCLIAFSLLFPEIKSIFGVEYLENLSECC